MNKTINVNSNIGKRLNKIRKSKSRCLLFNGKEIPLVGKITMGRDSKNAFVINDNMASRFHAVIQKIKDDYFIKDLNSTNGTFVNEMQVPKEKYVKLYDNDIIRIGRTEFSII
ncbi:MAG: FHA domain-containing protein [Spirochaetota bacterium]|nr:FHA domain-containing protein [Spirochaetota bacterium]